MLPVRSELRLSVARYGFAVTIFAIILGASLALSYFEYKLNLGIPVFIGMGLAAWYGGRGPGILFVGLVLAATFWRTPIPTDRSTAALVFGYLTAYFLLGFIVWLIAGRKAASINNRRLQRHNDMLLNSVGEGIIGLDLEGKCSFLNPAAATMLGWPLDELRGKTLHDLVHHTKSDGTPYPSDDCPIQAACREGRREHVTDDVFWHKNGSSFPVEYTSTPVGEKGVTAGAVVVFRDTTKERKAEAELRQQALLIEQSHEAIFVWDFERGIIQWNAGSERLYGFTKDEALGQVCYEMLRSTFPIPLSDFISDLKKNGTWSGEVQQQTKTGDRVFSSSRYQIIQVVGRKIVLQTNRDITDRKSAEKALHELNETLEHRVAERTNQLEAANKELEAFSYSVSHDLRAPLRAIDGFSRILSEDYTEKLDDEGRRVLDIIRTNAQNMGQLIDDLLAFSRLGRKQIEPTAIDMNELATAVSIELNSQAQLESNPFTINPLPETTGDSVLIRQVFVNLFSNALKYSLTKGNVHIEVGSQTRTGENIYFVRDQGVGFDMQYSNKLFGVFQRLHSPEEFEGTGVGLAIVQRVINRHGGRVWAEGEVDKGATFYFALPREETLTHER